MRPALLLLVLGLATGAATLLGGVLALRLRPALGLLFAFAGGAMIGVALLDLLPGGLALAAVGPEGAATTMTATAVGFSLGLILNRLASAGGRGNPLGPASLTAHSFMDGLGIGLAFQVSPQAGAVVAVAVLAHDFVDGANTVTLALAADIGLKGTRRWLVADALAPLCGIALSRVISLPADVHAVLLGLLGGFFLYFGATELLPQSKAEPPLRAIFGACCGLGVVYGAIRLADGG